MKQEEILTGLGRTIVTKWGEHCRIIKVTETYFTLDFPESRGYNTDGKLRMMPQKKVYFDTRNVMWNMKSFVNFEDNYTFKMKTFKRDVLVVKESDIEPNTLPTIDQSLKLVKREPRRTKKDIERAKLLGWR